MNACRVPGDVRSSWLICRCLAKVPGSLGETSRQRKELDMATWGGRPEDKPEDKPEDQSEEEDQTEPGPAPHQANPFEEPPGPHGTPSLLL